MPSVKFVNEKKTIEVPKGANLRKEALNAGIELYPGVHRIFNCHGLRQCASCRVLIKKGQDNVSPQGLFEKLRLIAGPITYFARIGHESDLRLACATKVLGDIEVETQPGARTGTAIVSGASPRPTGLRPLGLPNNGGGLRLTVRLQFPAPQSGG